MVLNEAVRMKYIRANLTAPGNIFERIVNFLKLL
jgi:hypothetical protein